MGRAAMSIGCGSSVARRESVRRIVEGRLLRRLHLPPGRPEAFGVSVCPCRSREPWSIRSARWVATGGSR